jgi:tRNA threonylcarbamoyladenosine biosynthesis protein TsaB|tara:strand:- start:7164 stop:7865 length:702 start_codon:yes stop_codon:yes gene_type:complete
MSSQPLHVLALDTSTEACTVALQCGSDIDEMFRIIPRAHNQQILPMLQAIIARAELQLQDLDLFVVGRGPGSFTGLRIATGVVQGLAFGLDKPVVQVSTLACLAQGQYRTGGQRQIMVALHARQEEIYWGCFEVADGTACAVGKEDVLHCRDLKLPKQGDWFGVGNGWRHRDLIEKAIGVEVEGVELDAYPVGRDLLVLGIRDHLQGRSVAAEAVRPVYLREKVTGTPDGSTR